ncbi:MAG: choice-of-anchor E domain-containing protein, partial [Planctomycetota bacterium]
MTVRNWRFFAFAAPALLCAFASPAAAQVQTVSYSTSVFFPLLTSSGTAQITRFDPALGILEGVTIDLGGSYTGTALFENLEPMPVVVAPTVSAQLTLSRPSGGGVLAMVEPAYVQVFSLDAFDGSEDFAGASGFTAIISESASQSVTSPPPLSDLALFSGSPGVQSSLSLPV